MSDYHTLPLKVDRYLAKTRHLTAAQHGAYLLLLMTAWKMEDNALPDDDEFLSRCASMDRRTWLRNKPPIMAFWIVGPDGRWRQRTLDETRKYVADVISKKSAAGHASALKRQEVNSTYVGTQGQHNGQQIKIKPKIETKEDRSQDSKTSEGGTAEAGSLVSSNAIFRASEMARARGWTGGNELGVELENIFMKFITITPDKPDLAFLKWVPSQLDHEIKHNGGPNG